MEIQKPVIRFYKKRTFGEKMSASFDFMRDNLKLLLKLCLYLILPLTLIQGIFFKSYISVTLATSITGLTSYPDEMIRTIIISALGMGFIALFVQSVLISIAFTSIQTYNENGTLKGLTFNDLKQGLIRNFKRSLLVSLALGGIVVLTYLVILPLAALSVFTLFLTIPGLFVFILALFMIYPVYIFEDIPMGSAIKKGTILGFRTWGGLFGILLVMGLIAGVVQGICSVPFYILIGIKAVMGMSDPVASGSFIMSLLEYLSGVLLLAVSYSASVLIYLGLAYHYSSAAESADAMSVNEDLENFEEL